MNLELMHIQRTHGLTSFKEARTLHGAKEAAILRQYIINNSAGKHDNAIQTITACLLALQTGARPSALTCPDGDQYVRYELSSNAPLEEVDDDADDDDDIGEEEFHVECILDHKMVNGENKYLIRWKGYDQLDDTWEGDEQVSGCKALIEEYFKRPTKVLKPLSDWPTLRWRDTKWLVRGTDALGPQIAVRLRYHNLKCRIEDKSQYLDIVLTTSLQSTNFHTDAVLHLIALGMRRGVFTNFRAEQILANPVICEDARDEPVFLHNGKPMLAGHLSRQVSARMKAAGFDRQSSFYLYRYGYAARVQPEIGEATTRALMGHKTSSKTLEQTYMAQPVHVRTSAIIQGEANGITIDMDSGFANWGAMNMPAAKPSSKETRVDFVNSILKFMRASKTPDSKAHATLAVKNELIVLTIPPAEKPSTIIPCKRLLVEPVSMPRPTFNGPVIDLGSDCTQPTSSGEIELIPVKREAGTSLPVARPAKRKSSVKGSPTLVLPSSPMQVGNHTQSTSHHLPLQTTPLPVARHVPRNVNPDPFQLAGYSPVFSPPLAPSRQNPVKMSTVGLRLMYARIWELHQLQSRE